MAVDDILLLNDNNNRIYRYSGGSWDSGIAVAAAATSPRGITTDRTTGEILIADEDTERIYRRDLAGNWDSGFAVPAMGTGPRGLDMDDAGTIYLVDIESDRIFRYANGSWDSGIAGPSGVPFLRAVAVTPDGSTIWVLAENPDRLYVYSGGSWGSGIVLPADGFGMARTPEGYLGYVSNEDNQIRHRIGGAWVLASVQPPPVPNADWKDFHISM